MSRLDRRTFLKGGGMLGAATALAGAGTRLARADKPINLSGWVFKPDTVKDYVDYFNRKHGGQVKYEALPWAQYHPTMETRAFAGEIVDVMYCAHNFRERWHENGLLRKVDDRAGKGIAGFHQGINHHRLPAGSVRRQTRGGSAGSQPAPRCAGPRRARPVVPPPVRTRDTVPHCPGA